jgi:outer membrane protein insertion porin family
MKKLRLSLTYTLEWLGAELRGSFQQPLQGKIRTSSAKTRITWDTRNNRLFPTDGFLNQFSVELAERIFGSESIFTRYYLISRWYHPLFWDFVFKFLFHMGYITSPMFDRIYLTESFHAGGINSVRGYYMWTICGAPEKMMQDNKPDSESVSRCRGGNKELIINMEIEFPIFKQVNILGVLFFDAGNVWSIDENWFYIGDSGYKYEDVVYADGRQPFNPVKELPFGLFMSVGFGFRWISPMGPLRFEWGIPLTPRPWDESILFEFTIGTF